MRVSYDFKDYECIDAGNGEKLERWKNVILRRPDPQAMWYTLKDSKLSLGISHLHILNFLAK